MKNFLPLFLKANKTFPVGGFPSFTSGVGWGFDWCRLWGLEGWGGVVGGAGGFGLILTHPYGMCCQGVGTKTCDTRCTWAHQQLANTGGGRIIIMRDAQVLQMENDMGHGRTDTSDGYPLNAVTHHPTAVGDNLNMTYVYGHPPPPHTLLLGSALSPLSIRRLCPSAAHPCLSALLLLFLFSLLSVVRMPHAPGRGRGWHKAMEGGGGGK